MSAAADAVLIVAGCCTGIQQLVTMTLTTTRENGQAMHNPVAVEEQYTTLHHSSLD